MHWSPVEEWILYCVFFTITETVEFMSEKKKFPEKSEWKVSCLTF